MTSTAVIHYLLQTGDLVSHTMYLVICFLLGPKKRKRKNINLDLSCSGSAFDTCATFWNSPGKLRDSLDWSKATDSLFTVCCTLYIIHSIQLLQALSRYMRYICIAWAVAVLWFLTQARYSYNRLLCGALCVDYECICHLYYVQLQMCFCLMKKELVLKFCAQWCHFRMKQLSWFLVVFFTFLYSFLYFLPNIGFIQIIIMQSTLFHLKKSGQCA